MLRKKLLDIYTFILQQTQEMVLANVEEDDLTGRIDFLCVFAHSDAEFDELSKDIAANGYPYDNQPSGRYYWLTKPLETSFGIIKRCRVRKPDTLHPDRDMLIMK